MPKYPKITSKKIKYDSPSGFVQVGKYIPPFEKNETGFGFKGVIVEDSKSGDLQCSCCGKWFQNLSTHIFAKHGLVANEYKAQFGLLISTALKSKAMRLHQSKVMSGLRIKNKSNRFSFKRGNYQAGNRKGHKKAVETLNKYGVCDLQIMQKVIELKNELGKTPTLIQLKKRYGGTFIFHLYRKYNSYVKYCREIDFDPNFSNFNPKYSREYFIEKALSNLPTLKIFTENEQRALYKYFSGGIGELIEVCENQKNHNELVMTQ